MERAINFQVCGATLPGSYILISEGTAADSNILKVYRMLDRNNGDKHYYQVGSFPPSYVQSTD